MKALLFTNLFPSPDEPTRGLFNLNRFRALADLCAVRVIVPVSSWRRIGLPSYRVRDLSDQFIGLHARYPTYWAIPRVAPQWHAEAMYRAVRSQAIDMRREFRFDVILGAFAYPDVVVASRLARDAGCPLVALVMGSDMNDLAQRPGLRDDIRRALHHASRVVAVSEALRRRVLELGVPRGRIVVQHNGVNGDRFRIRDRFEARRAVGISEHGHLLCFVGNLVYEKGPDVLIEALGRLRSAGAADLRIAFIGDGNERQALLSRAAVLALGDRVSFVGWLGPDDVALWMSAADALILPSRREGCPNVVLEALASGRPVVAAAVGGVPELLNDRNGIMVPADDPVALARGIAGALERQWDPSEVRASVPALTWKKVGRTLHDVLALAVFDHRQSLADRTRRTAPLRAIAES